MPLLLLGKWSKSVRLSWIVVTGLKIERCVQAPISTSFFRLHAYYEAVPGFVAVKNEVYAEYLATCSRFTIKNALNSTGFSDCIK